jgi:FkbM family methyltransferase
MKDTFNTFQLHKIFDISMRNTNKYKGANTFALVIGANNGTDDDTLGGYVLSFNWRALLIEPLPEHLNELKENFKKPIKQGKVIVAEECVSDIEEIVQFAYIPHKTIITEKLHPAIRGMSCIMPPTNGFATDPITSKLFEQHKVVIEFITKPINIICEEFFVEEIDYVQCDVEGYDYKVLSKFDFKKYRPKIFKFETRNYESGTLEPVRELFESNNYSVYSMDGLDALAIANEHLDYLRKNKRWEEVLKLEDAEIDEVLSNFQNDIDTDEYITFDKPAVKKSNVTVVTCLWDIRRDTCEGVFKRSFDTYLEKFDDLLKIENPMIIFTEKKVEEFILQRRSLSNTVIVIKEVDELKTWFNFYQQVQTIRNNPEWRNIASWLGESTQANLEMYNPVVMSKLFLLNDAAIYNSFKTDYYLWLDAGITSTIHPGYFTHDKCIDKLEKYLNKFLFVAFPYQNYEIHGFPESEMRLYANTDKITYVCRGGVFGGHKSSISKVCELYYSLLSDSLNKGLMGTEESIFTIIAHKYPDIVDRVMINHDGLIGTFFENLKNDNVQIIGTRRVRSLNDVKTNLYVITFNSPKQFRMLCEKYAKEDGFFQHATKYVLDNSSDLTTTDEYVKICAEYNFTHIKKDNLGICGGRQFIAEHFDETGADYCIFLEDDMFINNSSIGTCLNGFQTYIPNLYEKIHRICEEHGYDFLKFSFTEFYGDNKTQWAWYNVPHEYRLQNFPERPYLPAQGLDPYAPKTKFNNIHTIGTLPYIDGEIYYCNWPQIVSKEGNKKMFLTEKWGHPFEQTWMSYIYQQTKLGVIKGSLLLASPITHNRFDHYDGNARKES